MAVDERTPKMRKLEEPAVKEQNSCTVTKEAEVKVSGVNAFTFDLYDNTYSEDFKKNISLEIFLLFNYKFF